MTFVVRARERLARQLVRQSVRLLLLMVVPLESLDARKYIRVAVPALEKLGVTFDGLPRYISSRVYFDDGRLISMGEGTVVSRNVVFLTHDYSVTTALIASGEERPEQGDIAAIAPITIGRNVFVGWGAIILPGSAIGDDAVVGAGAVVRGHVAAGSVVVGNPAVSVGSSSAMYAEAQRRMQSGYLYRQDG